MSETILPKAWYGRRVYVQTITDFVDDRGKLLDTNARGLRIQSATDQREYFYPWSAVWRVSRYE